MENEEVQNLGQEALRRLDALAETLGVASEHIWQILVQQGTVEGIYGIVGMLLAFGFLMGALKLISTDWNKLSDDRIGQRGFGVFILTILGLILFLSGYFNLGYLFNPEYFAIQEIKSILD